MSTPLEILAQALCSLDDARRAMIALDSAGLAIVPAQPTKEMLYDAYPAILAEDGVEAW